MQLNSFMHILTPSKHDIPFGNNERPTVVTRTEKTIARYCLLQLPQLNYVSGINPKHSDDHDRTQTTMLRNAYNETQATENETGGRLDAHPPPSLATTARRTTIHEPAPLLLAAGLGLARSDLG